MAITGTQQPVSPSIQKQPSGNKVYTRVFKYERDYAWEAEMPAIGSFDATYGYFRGYQSANGPAYVTVTLTYDTEGTVVNFSPADGDTEYWAQTVGEEKPVEYHPDYKARRNYGLYAKRDIRPIPDETDIPAGSWLNDTDTSSLNGESTWAWRKSHPGVEWRQIRPPSKGYDFYLAPVRAVFQRDYYRQQSDAEAALATVNTLVNPAETFGATPTHTAPFTAANPGNWLVVSSNTQYDGKYWVTETEYWHSDGKNNRINPATGNASATPNVLGWDMEVYS